MNVCYFGYYDRTYNRNRVLRKGLSLNGVNVKECWSDHPNKLVRLYNLTKKYLSLAHDIDIVLVAEFGNYYLPLARLLASLTRKPLVFDSFISMYDSMITDRKFAPEGSLRAKYYYMLDKVAASLADLLLLDTEHNADYFAKTFSTPRSKFDFVWNGADPDLFRVAEFNREGCQDFRVVFVGSFIPFHGVEYVIKSAHLLRDYRNIKLELIGDGQVFDEAKKLVNNLELSNVTFTGKIPIEQVAEKVVKSDVCLGAFSDQERTRRVITNKVFEYMAAAKPVITGDGPSIQAILTHGVDALLVNLADPDSIAQAILQLNHDEALRRQIGQNGFETFMKTSTPQVLGGKLKNILQNIIEN